MRIKAKRDLESFGQSSQRCPKHTADARMPHRADCTSVAGMRHARGVWMIPRRGTTHNAFANLLPFLYPARVKLIGAVDLKCSFEKTTQAYRCESDYIGSRLFQTMNPTTYMTPKQPKIPSVTAFQRRSNLSCRALISNLKTHRSSR